MGPPQNDTHVTPQMNDRKLRREALVRNKANLMESITFLRPTKDDDEESQMEYSTVMEAFKKVNRKIMEIDNEELDSLLT
jgi:hypothetical protein